LQIEGGRITGCLLSGDFLALLPIRALEEKLEGLPYRKKEVREALEAIDPALFLGTITRDELGSCLFNQG
jgi:lipoate-protein ligase A